MATYDSFIAAHPAGSRIGDPLLVSARITDSEHMYQCVSYVKAFLLEVKGVAVDWPGNAIQFWSSPPHASDSIARLLSVADRISETIPHKGDIAVFKTAGRSDYSGEGHIGIATGIMTDGQMEIWEQNGQTGSGTGIGKDAIRTRWIDRSRLAGLLRLKTPVSAAPYVSAPFTGRLMLIRDSYKYDCNLRDFNERAAHPIEGVSKGHPFDAQAVYTTTDGNKYYSPDTQNSGGYHVNDCDWYVAPEPTAPPKQAITDYVPAKAKPIEPYELLTTVMTYKSARDAANKADARESYAKGTYIVWKKDDNGMINITKDNMKAGMWINPNENKPDASPVPDELPSKTVTAIQEAAAVLPEIAAPVEPVEPPAPTVPEVTTADWHETAVELGKSLSLFNLDGSPVYYNSINSRELLIPDMTGRIDPKTGEVATVPLKPFKGHIAMVGTVDVEDEAGQRIRYILPHSCYGKQLYYLAPMHYFKLDKKNFLETVMDVTEDVVNHIRTSEHLTAAQEKVKLAIQGFVDKRKKG